MDQVYGRLIKAAAEHQRQQKDGDAGNVRGNPAPPSQKPPQQQVRTLAPMLNSHFIRASAALLPALSLVSAVVFK
jgi:hypothetical protein